MRSFQVRTSIPLGGFVNDILSAAGINGYFGTAANITMYQNGDAVGLIVNGNWDDGQDSKGIIPNGSAVGVASTSGKVKTNEDFFIQFAIPAGVKLLINVQNPTGAAIDYNAQFVVT
jgi:hypothetical protein